MEQKVCGKTAIKIWNERYSQYYDKKIITWSEFNEMYYIDCLLAVTFK